MSWVPAFSGFWPWVVLAAVPLGIVFLYVLKLRRDPVEVPSTFLWTRTIEDLHANRLLQRLRNSILLLLQLLVILLAALALFRPGTRDQSSSSGRLVFLLDVSASMQAPAANSGPEQSLTRFELAQKQIGQRIDTMTDTETAMLISFSDRAEIAQAFTSDRVRLRDALRRCEPTNRSTDIVGALRAADGLANPRRNSQATENDEDPVAAPAPAELLLYSDGGFQGTSDFHVGNLIPAYHAIGESQTTNLAVASFSANRDLQNPNQVQAFATVVNTGQAAATAEASLSVEGRLVDAATVSLDPGEQTGLSFTIEAAGAVRMRFSLDLNDDLELDNTAYAALTPTGVVSVLVVSVGNRPLQLALTTAKAKRIANCEFVTPDYLQTDQYARRAAAGKDDLIIFDRCRPLQSPATNTFSIGTLPNDGWTWTTPSSSLALIDIDRTHPILRYLEMYSLMIFSGRGVQGPQGTASLIEADLGSVMAIAPRGGYRDLVLGFELVSQNDQGSVEANTNWYAERSWPVFLLNVLRHLAGAASSAAAPSYRPGETVPVQLENNVSEVLLVRTDGQDRESTLDQMAVGEGGSIEIVQTNLPGNYQLLRSTSGPGEPASTANVLNRFAINLFDPQESRLATKENVELGYETVTGSDNGLQIRREYWRPLLLLALAVLTAEWWLYTRRMS